MQSSFILTKYRDFMWIRCKNMLSNFFYTIVQQFWMYAYILQEWTYFYIIKRIYS